MSILTADSIVPDWFALPLCLLLLQVRDGARRAPPVRTAAVGGRLRRQRGRFHAQHPAAQRLPPPVDDDGALLLSLLLPPPLPPSSPPPPLLMLLLTLRICVATNRDGPMRCGAVSLNCLHFAFHGGDGSSDVGLVGWGNSSGRGAQLHCPRQDIIVLPFNCPIMLSSCMMSP